jgi:UDP-glucuronate decarboxylase
MGTKDEVTGPVNLGNPVEFTMVELAELVLELTGSKSKIEYADRREDDPTQRCPDISRARQLLDWEPKISLQKGLSKTIDYFDKLMKESGGGKR